MKTEKAVKLNIDEIGNISVLIQTIYFKEDGAELTREDWRAVLMPGNFERAEELLDDYYMNIVRAVWTNEVIEKYALEMEEIDKKHTYR